MEIKQYAVHKIGTPWHTADNHHNSYAAALDSRGEDECITELIYRFYDAQMIHNGTK